jgi:hypothetical protein
VSYADVALERVFVEPRLEIAKLTFGATAIEVAVLECSDAGAIIAAVLEAA